MFNTEDTYEVVIFSIGDTKAGTKMGKLQLKNTVDNSVLNCILWEETLNRFDNKIFRTGNLVRIVSGTFNERYVNRHYLIIGKIIRQFYLCHFHQK